KGLARLRLVLPALPPGGHDAVGDHLHCLLEGKLLPARSVGPSVLDAVLAGRALDVALRGLALRTEPAARDGARRVALDVRHAPVPDVDELTAPHRAVGADRSHRALRAGDPGLERPRPLRSGGTTDAERIPLTELTHEGPGREPPDDGHRFPPQAGDLRYRVCDARMVPLFIGASLQPVSDALPHTRRGADESVRGTAQPAPDYPHRRVLRAGLPPAAAPR